MTAISGDELKAFEKAVIDCLEVNWAGASSSVEQLQPFHGSEARLFFFFFFRTKAVWLKVKCFCQTVISVQQAKAALREKVSPS